MRAMTLQHRVTCDSTHSALDNCNATIQFQDFVVKSADHPGLPDDALLFARLVQDGHHHHAIEQMEPVDRISSTENSHKASWTSWFLSGLRIRDPVQSVWRLKGSIEVSGAIPPLTIAIMQQSTTKGTNQLCSIELTDSEIFNQPVGQKSEVTWNFSGGDDGQPSLELSVVISVILQTPPSAALLTHQSPTVPTIPASSHVNDTATGKQPSITPLTNPNPTNSLGRPTSSNADGSAFPGEQYSASLPHQISAVATTPVGHSVRDPESAVEIAVFLNQIMASGRSGHVLDPDIIDLFHERLLLLPDVDEKARHLSRLGDICCHQYLTFHSVDDLDRAISMYEDAVLPFPESHPQKGTYLSALGILLLRRFKRLGDIGDIHKSTSVLKDATCLIPDGHPAKPLCLNNLGMSFLDRFECLGDPADIDESISMIGDAVRLTPHSHPDKPGFLSNLGSSFFRLFDRSSDLADIDKSISMLEDAVRLTPDGHQGKPGFLTNLGNSFSSRFEHVGDLADIDKAISMKEDAVRLTPDGHHGKPIFLNNLATSFLSRFERLGDLADLDKSISMFEDAVRLTPDDHPDKPSRLNNLGNSFFRRFEHFGDFPDINQSISIFEDAVRLTLDSHHGKPGFLNNLGNSFLSRFERVGDLADIDRSISMNEDAVRLTPDGHHGKPGFLNNLGTSFLSRFERFGDLADLNKSILMREDALQLTPDGHPEKPVYLKSLGNSFLSRFERLGDLPDLRKAVSQFSICAHSSTGPPSIRFRASLMWASCAKNYDHPSLLEAYTVALNLLPRLAWLGLPIEYRHHELINAGKVVSDAAAFAIGSGLCETAIEWLEQGRSIVWGQLLQLRTPVDELQEIRPDIATRFVQVSNQLERASSRDPLADESNQMSLEQIGQRHRRLTSQWEELVKEIRVVPGFDQFLLPKKVLQLASAARSGPVIVLNINESHCDTLILRPGHEDVLHLPLPGFTLEKVQRLQVSFNRLLLQDGRCISSDRAAKLVPVDDHLGDTNEEFKRILSELWLHVVKPVLVILGFTTLPTGELSRIWWCPTGLLAFLPIHAAGLYNTTEPGSKLSEFFVSSYTPTLSALLETPKCAPPKKFQLLAIAQPSVPGQSPLPGTREELKRIEHHARNFSFHSLVHSDATVEGVISGMNESTWAHFACHGVQDISNPTESGLILGDGWLKLTEIIKMSLPHAELAFLSACQTATGSENLSEEAVHLAAGMLFAGYRGVIATMWSIMNRDAPQVADDVYAHLFKEKQPDHTQAAHALHYAVQKLRESAAGKSYLSWAPFVHIGM